MEKCVSQLLLYSTLSKNTVLAEFADIFRDYHKMKAETVMDPSKDWHTGSFSPEFSEQVELLTQRVHIAVRHILDLGTDYGFDVNLWQDYLTFLLLTDENSFTLSMERSKKEHGTAVSFAKHDFRVFLKLFHYDFSDIEKDLGISCLSALTDYQGFPKDEKRYNKNVAVQIRSLSKKLSEAKDENEFYDLVTDHYDLYGVGMIGMNRAFRIRNTDGNVTLVPVHNNRALYLSDLIGYEEEKKQLRLNTEAFLAGRKANNALLYGDAGTGKSSSVKALINEYYDQGLRMIEIYKYQFRDLSTVISMIKNRNYRFIIFIDDLSFEENEVEYKFLKAVIEGGVESRPDNVLIYATSNRRNLIRETWKDREDMEHENDVHHSDTLEEKMSLSARFGCRIRYMIPRRRDFESMVLTLAEREGIEMPKDELLLLANRFEMSHGSACGRTAQQFVDYLSGKIASEQGK